MKKIIILIVSLFLLSGCTATYKMTIDDGVKDELNIYMSQTEYKKFDSDPNNYLIMQYANQPGGEDTDNGEKIEGIDYYDFHKDDLNYIATYTSRFDDNKIGDSALIKNIFRDYTYRHPENELYIKTDKGFTFPYDGLTSVKIILESPYKVMYSNATATNGNQLIWNVTKSNADNFYVEVNYYTGTQESTDNSSQIPDDSQVTDEPSTDTQTEKAQSSAISKVILIAVAIVILLIATIVFIVLEIRKKQINKI